MSSKRKRIKLMIMIIRPEQEIESLKQFDLELDKDCQCVNITIENGQNIDNIDLILKYENDLITTFGFEPQKQKDEIKYKLCLSKLIAVNAKGVSLVAKVKQNGDNRIKFESGLGTSMADRSKYLINWGMKSVYGRNYEEMPYLPYNTRLFTMESNYTYTFRGESL